MDSGRLSLTLSLTCSLGAPFRLATRSTIFCGPGWVTRLSEPQTPLCGACLSQPLALMVGLGYLAVNVVEVDPSLSFGSTLPVDGLEASTVLRGSLAAQRR